MPHYKIICRKAEASSGSLVKWRETFPNVKSLAKYLNGLVKRERELQVIACYIEDNCGKHVDNVRFLQSEYANQKWLTGYKERLLANAVEIYGMDLKWNSGLRSVALVIAKEDDK